MNKKICIVTGANAGIGRQAAVQIAQKDYHVILACRNAQRGKEAFAEMRRLHPEISLELQIVDLGLRKSVTEFAELFNSTYDRLDVLIHNAAVFNVTQKKRTETPEGIETLWATNHLGPVLLTELLLEKLKKSENGRVITISSKGLLAKPALKVDLNDPEFKTKRFNVVNAYYQSKLAQLMYTVRLSERLKDTKVTANSIRVTAVKVDVSRHPELSAFMKRVYSIKAKQSIAPEVMAETYTHLATSPELSKITGRYFDEKNLEVDFSRYCSNRDNIDAVMALTQSYIPEMREN